MDDIEMDDQTRKERVGDLIALMQANESRFDMRNFVGSGTGCAVDYPDEVTPAQLFHTCGTTFCIAGYAAVAAGDEQAVPHRSNPKAVDIEETGRRWLGLSHEQAHEVFYRIMGEASNGVSNGDQCLTTLKEATAMLAEYGETGKVKWPEMEEAV